MKSLPKSLIAEKWVVNSSPIIALGRVGQVELLARLPQQIIVPQAVEEELLNAPQGDPARAAKAKQLFYRTHCRRLIGWQFWMTAQPVVVDVVYPSGLQADYP